MTFECGWPKKHWPKEPSMCPCGFIFPERITEEWPEAHAWAVKAGQNYNPKHANDLPLFRERLPARPKPVPRERL